MMVTYSYSYDSPVGTLYLTESDGFITHLVFKPVSESVEQETPLLARAVGQLREYFSGQRKSFDLPLRAGGTDFQRLAWDALREIPYGQTRTYKEQAAAMGRPNSFRSAGQANSKNPISIIVPCHRVIGANKTLTGYGGGLEVKRFLLELERKYL